MTSSNKPFGRTKIIILVSVILLTIAIAIAVIIAKQEKPIEAENKEQLIEEGQSDVADIKDDNSSLVMGEEYFGKNIEPEVELEPEFQPKVEEATQKPVPESAVKPIETATALVPAIIIQKPKPSVIIPPSREQVQIITYETNNNDQKESPLQLISEKNKNFPTNIASKPYDLSRILTTDTFIPAVLYSAINSEIPSKTVLAIVESDVVGFHGNNILIPRGSKLEGVYEQVEDKHARRMQITWFKITRPDGVLISLDAESADVQGASGVTGYLDQRLKDRYGGALLLSSINAMAQLSVQQNDVRQLAAVESFGREFGGLTAQIVRENINILPIITIKQGTRFNIRPLQNIYFRDGDNDQIINAIFIK